MLLRKIRLLLVSFLLGIWTLSSQAAEWTMASGYQSNFHTQNIIKFIDDVKSGSSVKINLNPNDTLIKLDAIKTSW